MKRLLLLACFAFIAACGATDGREDRTPTEPAPAVADQNPPAERGQCENFSLDYGPVTLPPATMGEPYDVIVGDYAERDWYGTEYDGSATPVPGLTLEGKSSRDTLRLRGTPSEAGAFDFTIRAVHGLDSNGCSTMPDPHAFHLEVVAPPR